MSTPTYPNLPNRPVSQIRKIFAPFLNLSLRLKLMVAFLLVTALVVGVVAFFTDWIIRAELTDQAGATLTSISANKADEISQTIKKEEDTLRTVALNNLVQDAVEAAGAANQNKVAQAEELDRQWQAASSADDNAGSLVAGVLNNEVAAELREIQAAFPQHAEIFVTDKHGLLVAATNRTSDYYQADEAWWQAAYKNGQGGVFIDQPEFDESAGVYAMNIALPIADHNHQEIVGVLRTTLNIDVLTRVLTTGRFGQTGHTDIYLPDGREIELENEDGQLELVVTEGQIAPEALAQFQVGASYLAESHQEQPSLMAGTLISPDSSNSADLEHIRQLGWVVVAVQDYAEALQLVETAARTTLLGALGALVAAGLLGLGIAHLLAAPITRLTGVVTRIAQGDLNIQAPVESGDEIGALATSFNQMTGQLQDTLTDLERRVGERTRGLLLAAKVAQQLATVRSLDTLLAESVQQIHATFGLYHTQIYLVDPTGRTLTLHAATGSIGEQLLRRGHRLPVKIGSINGTAAAEMRAVIVADTTQSATFLPNPLLPNTRSEIAVPLLVGERVVGVLDMQHDFVDALSEENLPAFEALAGQLAIAIENARLFVETEQARTEIEAYTQQLTGAGWSDFLDGVNRSERLGYNYEAGSVGLLADALPEIQDEHALAALIEVNGYAVGQLQLEDESGRSWTSVEVELISAVAVQVGQQLENLRLLAQAEQYQAEAEAAVRLTTRQGWTDYVNNLTPLNAGYGYDQNRVTPLLEDNGSQPDLTQPLTIRGETVGELIIEAGDDLTDEAAELLAAVAEQLSVRLENARLTEQTAQALTQTEEQADRLTGALKTAKLAYWEFDVASEIFTFNDQFYALMRTSAEQEGGYLMSAMRYAQKFVHPDEAYIVGAVMSEAIDSTDPHFTKQVEHRFIRADGSEGHILVRFREVKDAQGIVVKRVGANQDITERKQAEEALRENESRLADALNTAKLAYWEFDVASEIFSFNDQFYALMRTSAEQEGGYLMSAMQYAQKFVHPAEVYIVGAAIKEAIETTDLNYTGELEHRFIRADGSEGYLLVKFRAVKDEQGNTDKLIGANQDITERKQAQLTLLLHDEAMASSENGITIADATQPDMPLIYVNAAFERITGYSADEVLNQNCRFLQGPETNQPALTELRSALKNKQACTIILRNYRKDGTLFWNRLSLSPIFDDAGNMTHFVGVLVDISDQIQAEETIAKRAVELQTVAEVSTAASTILETTHLLERVVDLTKESFSLYHAHIYLLNEAGDTLVLAAGAGDVGTTMVAQGWQIPLSREKSLVARAARSQEGVIVNDVQADPEFLPNPLLPETRSEMAVPLVVGDKVLGVLDVQADRANRFSTEDIHIQTTLAAQIAAALENARLFEESKRTAERLREVDRLKSEFLANMSHELRTPLNSIIGYSEMMLMGISGEIPPELNEDIEAIYENGKHLLQLISDILDLAKIEAGRLVLRFEPVGIEALLDEIKVNNAGLFLKKDIELRVEAEENLPMIQADPLRLNQVLNNLISNAAKFTNEGYVKIRAYQEADRLCVDVEDTGIGMSEEDLGKIFEKFMQVDGSFTRRAEGTGLGLAITRHLIEMHGGEIDVRSQLGQGTVFTVSFPIEMAEEDLQVELSVAKAA